MNSIKKSFLLIVLSAVIAASAFAQIEVPDVELDAEIIRESDSSYIIRIGYDFPEGYHQVFQEDYFKFEIISPSGVETGPISYPAGISEGDSVYYYGKTYLEAKLLNISAAGSNSLQIKTSWQLCDEDGMCLFPQSAEITAEADFQVAGAADGAGASATRILFILLLAFVGGLLLNVMPCVLPVLSIKALSLVKQGGEDRKQILISSLLYTAGVIISLLALAVIIIIIKASGEQVGWGFQFQNRGFVIVLLTVIFVFALSLFEVFTISAPVMKTGAPMNRNSGSAGSHFFSGVIAVLLATPCTAPFLGTAAGFAFSQSAPVILAVFFMVGAGLAFPFILIGFIPKIVSRLPKPGAWMNTFREVMGFLLIGTSVWLIDVLVYQTAAGSLTRILIYLTAVTLAAWLYGKLSAPGASTRRRIAGAVTAVVIIAASAFLMFGGNSAAEGENTAAVESSQYSDWLDFTPGTVYDNIGGEQPVFVAFGAKWCMTCRTNERTVLFTNDIKDFFSDNDVILIHGDYTNENPEMTEWMKEFGRAGVPFYLWYPAGSFEPVLLPEIINKRMITSLVE